MCGRFTLRTPASVLIVQFDLDASVDRQLKLFEPRYNIAPTQEVLAIRADPRDGHRSVATLRWGLIPSWTKEPISGPPMINARAETLADKPTFRTAFRSRRCLIPADGFYEWQQSSGGGKAKKQPFFIHRPDHAPFAFAGLWETWKAKPLGDQPPLTVESCTIVTTTANKTLSELHDRMPVILAPGDYANWLDPALQDTAVFQHLLAPCGEDELVAEAVGSHVNRATNDDPRCIAPQRSLFS
jgi:putative SOS response-associated peptidase YedK